MYTIEDYHRLVLENGLFDLDIAILCLNAGRVSIGLVDQQSDTDIESTITLNALHVVYFTKAMLNQLRSRSARSAIIIVSSGISGMPIPGVSTYSCTKSLVSNFGQALHYEVRDKIDVTVWEPGSTDTKIIQGTDRSYWTMPPSQSVDAYLCQHGKTRLTCGSMKHDIASIGNDFFPLGLIGGKIADQIRKEYDEGKYDGMKSPRRSPSKVSGSQSPLKQSLLSPAINKTKHE